MNAFLAKWCAGCIAFLLGFISCCYGGDSLREKCERLVAFPKPELFIRQADSTPESVEAKKMVEQLPSDAVPVTIEVLSQLDKNDIRRRKAGMFLLMGLLEAHAGKPEYWRQIVDAFDKQVREIPNEHSIIIVEITCYFVENHYTEYSLGVLARLLNHPVPKVRELVEGSIERMDAADPSPKSK